MNQLADKKKICSTNLIQEKKKFWNIALIVHASNFYFHNITPRNQFENNSIFYK